MQEMWIWSLGREDPLEEDMATHSSIHAWEIPWTEKPCRLQSMGSQRVGHDLGTRQQQQDDNKITRLIAHHLCHSLLVRTMSQVLLICQEKGHTKAWSQRERIALEPVQLTTSTSLLLHVLLLSVFQSLCNFVLPHFSWFTFPSSRYIPPTSHFPLKTFLPFSFQWCLFNTEIFLLAWTKF